VIGEIAILNNVSWQKSPFPLSNRHFAPAFSTIPGELLCFSKRFQSRPQRCSGGRPCGEAAAAERAGDGRLEQWGMD